MDVVVIALNLIGLLVVVGLVLALVKAINGKDLKLKDTSADEQKQKEIQDQIDKDKSSLENQAANQQNATPQQAQDFWNKK